MRYLLRRIIITHLFCLLIIYNPFDATELAHGGGNAKPAPPPFLLPKNTTVDGSFISESDIIIMVDEPDEVSSDEVSGDEESQAAINNRKSVLSLKLASEYLEKGMKFEARNVLSDLYFAETYKAKRIEIKNRLDVLNKELVFSGKQSPDAVFYVVKRGDTLSKIASKYGTNYEFIMHINGKSRTNIRIGERLKVINGKVSILVDKSDFTLTLLLNGRFIKQYSVGLGKADKTPVGVFVVDNKLINPVWYSPEGKVPFGHPKNVLGTRWIGFDDKDGYYGYGIHGTTVPESIGKEESNGCIRLRNEDVEELFNFVKPKTNVVIQE